MTTVAVLGGGISGLSAAYYLARLASPKTRIVLIEGSDRCGGWIRSQRTQEHGILFEAGPRSLRPVSTSGVVTLEMIKHLQLDEDIIAVPKTDPSAKNRYVYYNDHINVLPNSLRSFLFHKPDVMKSVLSSILLEPFKPVSKVQDESIYSLVARRFNEHVALNLVGAIVHGIYAGDIKQLSVKSTLRLLYDNEHVYGSIVKGMLKGGAKSERFRERGMAARARKDDPDWFADMEQQSVIGFKDGTEALTHRLRRWLEAQDNVQVVMGEPVRKLDFNGDKECKITTDKQTFHAEHVISALPSKTLDTLISSSSSSSSSSKPLPHLSANPSVDVAVVNLAYTPDTAKLDLDGFGFLTPHPDSKYRVPVPGTLGVVFDSNAIKGQDSNNFVKATVMMGGHQWSQAFNAPIEQLDPQDAYDKAIQSMKSYLGIDAQPVQSMIHLQAKCIPQYLVGHQECLKELHFAVKNNFGHSLSVTGASYWGVSVPDCIKNSRELVEELVVSGALGSRNKIITGLSRVEELHDSDRFRDSARISKGHVNVLMRS